LVVGFERRTHSKRRGSCLPWPIIELTEWTPGDRHHRRLRGVVKVRPGTPAFPHNSSAAKARMPVAAPTPNIRGVDEPGKSQDTRPKMQAKISANRAAFNGSRAIPQRR
jgi:hypothetical protein